MNNSPTEGAPAESASTEPTVPQEQQTTAETVNQETSSGANTQESVSDGTAQQTQQPAEQQTQTQKSGESEVDDSLAKFAKSQGVADITTLSEDAQRFLKIAHDNQKAFRERGSQSQLAQVTADVSGEGLEARVARIEAQEAASAFFSQEGKDRSLETKMAEILTKKKEQYGQEYASVLSKDLDLLYSLALVENGGQVQAPVDAEAIRQAERESINRQMSASTATPHATQGMTSPAPTVTPEWIQNEYDPRNAEHRKIVDEYYSQQS